MYLLASVPHVCTLIAPPAAASFMQVSIWLSFEIACGTLALGSVLVWLMPESLKHQQTTKDNQVPHVEAFPSLDEDEEPLLPEEQPHENVSGSTLVPSRQLSWWQEIKELFEIPGLRFCFSLFFIVPIALISKAFVYQVRPPPKPSIWHFTDINSATSTPPKNSTGPTPLQPGFASPKPPAPPLSPSSPSPSLPPSSFAAAIAPKSSISTSSALVCSSPQSALASFGKRERAGCYSSLYL